jgi:hypothetical protein
MPTVLPTGRNFCRRTQKWPEKNTSGRRKLRPILHQKGGKSGRKVAELFLEIAAVL